MTNKLTRQFLERIGYDTSVVMTPSTPVPPGFTLLHVGDRIAPGCMFHMPVGGWCTISGVCLGRVSADDFVHVAPRGRPLLERAALAGYQLSYKTNYRQVVAAATLVYYRELVPVGTMTDAGMHILTRAGHWEPFPPYGPVTPNGCLVSRIRPGVEGAATKYVLGVCVACQADVAPPLRPTQLMVVCDTCWRGHTRIERVMRQWEIDPYGPVATSALGDVPGVVGYQEQYGEEFER